MLCNYKLIGFSLILLLSLQALDFNCSLPLRRFIMPPCNRKEDRLTGLPAELIRYIMERLSGRDITNVASACSILHHMISDDESLWRLKLAQVKFENMPGDLYRYKTWRERFRATQIYNMTHRPTLAAGSHSMSKRYRSMYRTSDLYRLDQLGGKAPFLGILFR